MALVSTKPTSSADAESQSGSSYWWVWVLGAVVLVGAGAGTYFALKQGGTDVPPSDARELQILTMRTPPAVLRHAVRLLASSAAAGRAGPELLQAEHDPAGQRRRRQRRSDRASPSSRCACWSARRCSQFSVPTVAGGADHLPDQLHRRDRPLELGRGQRDRDGDGRQQDRVGTTNLASLDVGNENVVTVHLGFARRRRMPASTADGTDGGVDAPTDGGADAPSDTGAGRRRSTSDDLGGDVPRRDGTGGAGWAARAWAGRGWAVRGWAAREWAVREWAVRDGRLGDGRLGDGWLGNGRLGDGRLGHGRCIGDGRRHGDGRRRRHRHERRQRREATPSDASDAGSPTTRRRSAGVPLALCAARAGGSAAAARTMG